MVFGKVFITICQHSTQGSINMNCDYCAIDAKKVIMSSATPRTIIHCCEYHYQFYKKTGLLKDTIKVFDADTMNLINTG